MLLPLLDPVQAVAVVCFTSGHMAHFTAERKVVGYQVVAAIRGALLETVVLV